jgi:hypothetical protein
MGGLSSRKPFIQVSILWHLSHVLFATLLAVDDSCISLGPFDFFPVSNSIVVNISNRDEFRRFRFWWGRRGYS